MRTQNPMGESNEIRSVTIPNHLNAAKKAMAQTGIFSALLDTGYNCNCFLVGCEVKQKGETKCQRNKNSQQCSQSRKTQRTRFVSRRLLVRSLPSLTPFTCKSMQLTSLVIQAR